MGLDWTYHAHCFILVTHFNFLFVPCGRLSWLPVNFLLHVKYTLSYRIVFDQPLSRQAGSTFSYGLQQPYRSHHARSAWDRNVLSVCAELCPSCDWPVYPRVLQTPANSQSASVTRPCSSHSHNRLHSYLPLTSATHYDWLTDWLTPTKNSTNSL